MLFNKLALFIFIFQSASYILFAFGFLIPLLNGVQKAFTKVIRNGKIYYYVETIYFFIAVAIVIAWMQTRDLIQLDLTHIEQHFDKTSLSYIEDKEDLFRNERNLYLYAGAFLTTLANLRFLAHIHSYYNLEDEVRALKQVK